MGAGGSSQGSPGTLDVGPLGSPLDNTFTRASTVAGATQPYWSGWWTWTPDVDGVVTLDASDTTGAGTNDTFMWLYGDFGGSFPIDSDDDSGDGSTSRIVAEVFAGVQYWVQLGSFHSTGDNIVAFHVAASFAAMPALPNPRTFRIPGGTLTPPGVVMGPGSVDAPLMPPLSVSTPTDGTLPDATFILDATSLLDDPDITSLPIELDATLSYLTDGTADFSDPEVGINVFYVDHGMPFTWEEDWSTLVTDVTDGVDDYGRDVPRGQYGFTAHAGKTYIIQLTTPPGNDVRFVLRVSLFGGSTEWDELPAHQILTAFPDGTDDLTLTPSITGYTPTSFFGYTGPGDTTPGSGITAKAGAAFSQAPGFDATYQINRGFGSAHYPAAEDTANDCAWIHARQGSDSGGQWWTSDLTVDGGGDPTCAVVDGKHDVHHNWLDSPIGYRSTGSTLGVGGENDLRFEVFASSQRVNLSAILAQFNGTAGYVPFSTVGGGDFPIPSGAPEDADLVLEDVSAAPAVTRLDVRGFTLDQGSSGVGSRWFLTVVETGGGRGWVSGWGPQGETADAEWTGDSSPDEFVVAQDMEFVEDTWIEVDPDLVTMGTGFEAASTDGDGYQGSLLLTVLPVDLSHSVPGSDPVEPPPPPVSGVHSIPGAEVTDEAVSSGVVAMLRLTLEPTRHRWTWTPAIPAVVIGGGTAPLRKYPRSDGLGTSSVVRHWPPPLSIQASNRRVGGYL